MKLSKNTLDILSNFAKIYDAIVINETKEGDTSTLISTTTPNFHDYYAEAYVPEIFVKPMKIYNLDKFVRLVRSLGDPDLVLEDNSVTLVTPNAQLRYMYSDHIEVPDGIFVDPEYILEYDIAAKDFGNLLNISNTLELPLIKIFTENNKIFMELVKTEYEANAFRLEVGTGSTDQVFTVSRDKLFIIEGDYSVKISDGCAVLYNKSIPTLKYAFGLGVDQDE